jgi:hypothetical protein
LNKTKFKGPNAKKQILQQINKNKTLASIYENTEGAIKNGQSRETGNIGYTRQRKTEQKHNTLCVGHHFT